ncbi:MAG: hypothetical protein BWY70_01958 [Bacteroidetes bacterium ADurb.Bin408]|nr:MAG: hypothetical protein BWY70_01958 [Bacteroidetes bacterium ADurb.Bin408]
MLYHNHGGSGGINEIKIFHVAQKSDRPFGGILNAGKAFNGNRRYRTFDGAVKYTGNFFNAKAHRLKFIEGCLKYKVKYL